MAHRKIVEGSTLTLEVTVIRVWDDGRVTFRLYDHDAPITIPGDAPNIILVSDPENVPRKKQKPRQR
ncbi:MAG TPA: hypothetical protein VF226_02865 [Hyphomicrobiaceae bacterium]